MRADRGTPDIWIVGLGIRSVDHATRELERVVRSCREVLFVDTGVATGAWITSLGARATPLYGAVYAERGARTDAYVEMAARVLDAALDGGPVAFGMQGHPLVYSAAPFLIRDAAQLLGLHVEALPGVSSLDCLFADLWLDPCVEGLQMYEATDMLLRRRPLVPDVPLLVWQAGTLGTRLHSARRSLPERFAPLREYLLATYPPDHPVTAYYASQHPLVPTSRVTLPLSTLGDDPDLLHPGVTLLLPAVGPRPIADPELLRALDDPNALRRVTR